jgi:hypothetical protein
VPVWTVLVLGVAMIIYTVREGGSDLTDVVQMFVYVGAIWSSLAPGASRAGECVRGGRRSRRSGVDLS